MGFDVITSITHFRVIVAQSLMMACRLRKERKTTIQVITDKKECEKK